MPTYRCNILHPILGMYLHNCQPWYTGVVGVGLPMSNCVVCVRVCNISSTLVPILGHTHLRCIHNPNTVLLVFVYLYLPGESVYLVHVNLCIFIYVYLYNML